MTSDQTTAARAGHPPSGGLTRSSPLPVEDALDDGGGLVVAGALWRRQIFQLSECPFSGVLVRGGCCESSRDGGARVREPCFGPGHPVLDALFPEASEHRIDVGGGLGGQVEAV